MTAPDLDAIPDEVMEASTIPFDEVFAQFHTMVIDGVKGLLDEAEAVGEAMMPVLGTVNVEITLDGGRSQATFRFIRSSDMLLLDQAIFEGDED